MKRTLILLLCLLWAGSACSKKLPAKPSAMPATNLFGKNGAQVKERGDAEGIYAIWYGKQTAILDHPWIKGGQITMQWGDIEKGPGIYDWQELDAQMKAFNRQNRRTTLQFNGNVKPAWMFDVIPYYPGRLSIQVRDANTLMFWHPHFKKAYVDFLAALGEHLKASPYMSNVLGLRMNLNAYGTEQISVTATAPEKDLGIDHWVAPVAGDPDMRPWSRQEATQYTKEVFEAHIKYIAPAVRVFVRNSIDETVYSPYSDLFRRGILCWFHTSSEAESRGNEHQYLVFMDYCRTGLTPAYAEPWASAWGEHGGITDPRFCSPEQWNYWRILMDVNCGVSYMAIYANDLEVYTAGMKSGKAVSVSMRKEFREAFEFGMKYTSQHLYPETTPGVWAAFRSCDRSLCWDKPLKYLTEDYTLLALVQPGKSYGEHNVGPDGERYGAWARRLPAGEAMSVVMDPRFAASISGTNVTLKVIYLDESHAKWHVAYAGQSFEVSNQASGQWKEVAWQVAAGEPSNDEHACELIKGGMVAGRNKEQIAALHPDITITALSGLPAFHMVEILR